MALPKIPKLDQLKNADQGTKNIVKPILICALILLLGAFGLEATNNDWDLGALLRGSSAKEAKLQRDADGNLVIKRDGNGTFALDNCKENTYNCSDFKTKKDAQDMFDNCGGKGSDVNRLDGDNDGVACEDLK